jgi:tRNA 2-thiouridine synthesizing protein A
MTQRDEAAPGGVPDDELDARGLLCPLPVLKARKRLQALGPGGVLAMLADDPAAAVDVPFFCAEAGHALLDDAPAGGTARRYLIRKAGGE